MLSKIVIVDFEDSFTYNIANTLYEHFSNVEVIDHKSFFKDEFFNKFIEQNMNAAIILGPGPGHPNNHSMYFVKIRNLLVKNNIFILGICLGHQILGLLNGYEIEKCSEPIHGQSVDFIFNEKVYKVQKYNSLCVVKNCRVYDVLSGDNWISYQFHPESVGTTNNIDFFHPLLKFFV